jgi:very-short-patch-repair endonuclease
MRTLPRVLTASGAARLGFTDARIRTEIRRGRWQRLASGLILTRPDEPTRTDWINAGMVLGGPAAALIGWDAARLRGLGGARPPTPHVLVLTTSDHRNRIVGGVHLRPSRRPLAYSTLSALDENLPLARIAATARVVADTSLIYPSLAPVRALVTSAVQRGLCSAEELQRELDFGPRNGSAHLRRALDDVFGGAASISEAELADMMRAAGLPPFELNVPILDHAGNHVATADVLWREVRAVLEVDSKEHHFLEPQWKRTMRRHNKLTRRGLAVTHYPPAELRGRTAEVMTEIDEWLRARAVELGVRHPPRPPDQAGTPLVLPPPVGTPRVA